ncbi:MAG TPA: hypothetical protein VFV99_14600 [Kofleriaceae bacterium]|nr:hypothetical protein [Kofleriaceae bacterium]
MADKNPSTALALVNPVGLGVAAGAATVAIALTNPLIGVVGGGVWLATVAIDAIRRSRKKKKRAAVSIPMMKDPDDIVDPTTRAAVQKILANKAELQKILDETPADLQIHISKTLGSLDELEMYAVRLVERAEDITTHLSKMNLPALVAEVKQLATRAAAAKDPVTRQSYEEAKQARMDEIRSLKEIKTTKDRIDANLMRVVAVMGALPTKVVHMRALDAQALDQLSGDISHDLSAIGEELKTSEAVIKQQLVAQ